MIQLHRGIALPCLLLTFLFYFVHIPGYGMLPHHHASRADDSPAAMGSSTVHLFENNTSMRRLESSTNTTIPPIAIFFHIYVPKAEDSVPRQRQRALKIIRQQLRHLSEALDTVPGMEPAALYYTTVGEELEPGYVQEICKEHSANMHCHHLQHLNEGFEEHSLAALYNHCQQHENDRVIYIHTKGSFHSSKSQSRWRRHMTDAVGSRECIETAHREGCDICGLLFLPRPSFHFTGNMFNAQCSYVQKLLNPFEFQDEMTLLELKSRHWLDAGIFQSNLLNMSEPWNTGVERYAMEHWHGSHPSVRVCDVSVSPMIEYWQGIRAMDRKEGDWELAHFPRHSVAADWSFGGSSKLTEMMNNESARLREYFLLPGQLLRWLELYGEVPPQSSWVWSWYPDGEFWYNQVKQHGVHALLNVSNQWRHSNSSYV